MKYFILTNYYVCTILIFFHAAQYIQYRWQSEVHNQIVVTGIERSTHAELKMSLTTILKDDYW